MTYRCALNFPFLIVLYCVYEYKCFHATLTAKSHIGNQYLAPLKLLCTATVYVYTTVYVMRHMTAYLMEVGCWHDRYLMEVGCWHDRAVGMTTISWKWDVGMTHGGAVGMTWNYFLEVVYFLQVGYLKLFPGSGLVKTISWEVGYLLLELD